MAWAIPDSATRLQAMAFVHGAELENVRRAEIIRHSAREMAERAVHKILTDCVKNEGGYAGYPGQTLRLDAYVIEPNELYRMLADARIQGEKDALFWNRMLGATEHSAPNAPTPKEPTCRTTTTQKC